MKKRHSIWVIGIVAAVTAFGLFVSAVQMPRRGPQKILPIKFIWQSSLAIEKNMAARIEKDNAMLAGLIAMLRENPKLSAADVADKFANTYLRNPRLRTEDGSKYSGWTQVLPALKAIVDKSTYIDVQAVGVFLEYVAYDAQRSPSVKEDIDIKAVVRTTLALAPEDPIEMEGDYCHRRICEMEPCPPIF